MVERKRKIFLNILKNFGIFHFTVERVLKGLGNIPTSKMRSIFRKRVPFSYACYGAFTVLFCDKDIGKERNGKTIAATNKRFYVVRGVTQLKTAFVGKAINSLPFEN